jgi:glycosyltransferase involved in cell wall biosynthesis
VYEEAMLTVVIPTHNSEEALAYTLAALVPAAADGVVSDVIVADAGSTDGTIVVADAAGCAVVRLEAGVGRRLKAGAEEGGRGRWLLFLPPDAVLEPGWHREVGTFVERVERSGQGSQAAAVFRFAVDAFGVRARFAEWRVAAGGALTGLPAAEQGLLISRRFYEALGGHRDLSGIEEVDLARRIGRARLHVLGARARVRAARSRPGKIAGYALLALRLPPALVARLAKPRRKARAAAQGSSSASQ